MSPAQASSLFPFQDRSLAERVCSREDDGTPRGIRTPDLLLRRQLLYPAELLAHIQDASRSTPRQSPAKRTPAMERVMGIEPTYPAWKAGVLPLNYTRMGRFHIQP